MGRQPIITSGIYLFKTKLFFLNVRQAEKSIIANVMTSINILIIVALEVVFTEV